MDLRINDQASVGLGGGLVRALRRQDRAGAKGTGDKAASSRHGSILPQIATTAFIQRRRLANRLCDLPTPGHNSIKREDGVEMT
jgi:hypothetical protein